MGLGLGSTYQDVYVISLDLAAVAVEVRAKHINRAYLGANADRNGQRRSDSCTGMVNKYANIRKGRDHEKSMELVFEISQ